MTRVSFLLQTLKTTDECIVSSLVSLLTATAKVLLYYLKGLGHAILGNFSTDQMVIELTEI